MNGQLHLRTHWNGTYAPVTLPNGADVQFNGSIAADRRTLHRSWSAFTGSLTFNGNGGHDQLDARAVSLDIRFNGGDGNDTLLGGIGDDTADGGLGRDNLAGGDGYNSLSGGNGNDSLTGSDGNDRLLESSVVIYARHARNWFPLPRRGGEGEGEGAEWLNGIRRHPPHPRPPPRCGGEGARLRAKPALRDAGIDTLLGDAGNDTSKGGAENDIINPGSGTNSISDTTKVIDLSFTFDFDALLASLL